LTRLLTHAKMLAEMRTLEYFLAVAFLLSLSASAEPTPQGSSTTRRGYAVCAGTKNSLPVPIYEHPCKPPVGEIKCGESVEVLSRKGPYFKMGTSDGSERYIGVTAVSQSKNKFIAIDLPFVPWPNVEDCSVLHEKQGGTHRPIAIFSPTAEYSEKARKAKISGSVELSLTVGTDGTPHDIVVTKSLGYGLDENAVAAVKQWKFDPAAEDGKPIPASITLEVNFRLD
jgi:TonB family protein